MTSKNKVPGRPTKRVTNDGGGAPGNPTESKASASQDARPPLIKKGVYLSALIYIEGAQAPAADFTQTATDALKRTLQQAFSQQQDKLSLTLKKVEVQNDVEQDDHVGSSKQEDKFQF